MSNESIRKTKIYAELEDSKNRFEFTPKKFIQHIDTFYFTVMPVQDWTEDGKALLMKSYLAGMRKAVEKNLDSVTYRDTDLVMNCGFSFGFYLYHLGLQDSFDIFVCDTIPNSNTPPIVVQLRSQFIWCNGIHKAIDISVNYVRDLLYDYGMDILEITENRIDYAYHTNYIQDQLNFFPDNALSEMQVSNFKRWHKEGSFFGDNTDCDYFTLGRRKSNNVFFRVYNKTKEVVELGYKQFFIMIWLLNGLISHYDAYILAECFKKGSYEYKEKARCEYYLLYGQDEQFKNQIAEMNSKQSTPLTEYKKLADLLVPDVTIITNIEFQTKRKFYSSLQLPDCATLDTLPYMRRLKSLLVMQNSILNMLTNDTIRFVKYKGENIEIRKDRRVMADWWNRLRSCKAFECDDITVELFREYQTRLDTEKMKQSTLQKIACVGLYLSRADEDRQEHNFNTDLGSLIGNMNDNDIQKYYRNRHKKQKEIKSKFQKFDKEKEGEE